MPSSFWSGARAISKRTTPNGIGLCRKRREQRGEKLITHRNPFRACDVFLIKGPRGALPKAKKTAATPEPADIDPFCFSGNAPG